ncbi:MAG: BatA domain-containing protein [Planctomycetota bacterium]
MSFVNWIFLLGGLAVVGPVIAHMLAKPRYRRVLFTMLRFLREGQVESQSRRKLRDVLILLLRCAIIVLIAMLFARPILHTRRGPEETRSVYYLGLDNSMSMAYSDGSGSYFGKLVDSAVEYIRSADDEGMFNICALGSGDWTSDLSKEQALAEVKGLRIGAVSTNVSEFFSALKTARKREHPSDIASVFVVSDFTPNTLKQLIGVEETAAVENVDYKLITSSKPINNAAIVDAGVNSIADGKLTMNVTVVNYGQVEQNRRLTAKTGTSKSTSIDTNLSANQGRTYQIQIDTGFGGQEHLFLPVELSLSAGDGLKEDDTFYVGVYVPPRKSVNVLLADKGGGEMFLLRTALNALSRVNSYETLNLKQVLTDDLTLSDLKWADVIVCSAIAEYLGETAGGLKDFVREGGRVVFFVAEEPSSKAAKRLWDEGILAAIPRRFFRERAYLEPRPCNEQSLGMDNVAAKVLTNYRVDRIVLTGYFDCEQHSGSSCLWRLQNGFGFVYLKRLDSGSSVFVNTSVDDSLGALTKSNASVAFCRYLLGQTSQIGEYCFACDERVMLPAYDMKAASGGRKQFWVETCDGRKRRAALAESLLVVSDSGGIGWVKTLSKPIRYAGVNLPKGETDMTKPVVDEVAKIMHRMFTPDRRQDTAAAELLPEKKQRPVWKMFAWIIILLLLIEPAVANRLRR